jgi:hypothetical protein
VISPPGTSTLSVFGSVGDVVILDRANSSACEARVIGSTTHDSVTLNYVKYNHSQGATFDFGLVIREQKTLPAKRSITCVLSWPIVRTKACWR